MTERAEMEAALEAILFVSSEPIPRERLLEIFDEDERGDAGSALDAVLERHRGADGRGFMVDEAGGGVRLVTRPELHGWLRRFFEVSSVRKLSMGALETLAIVAYRQPVTAPEIQELRGVSSSGVLKTLLERRMVRISGRKQVVGKPFLYSTTREFLVHFGLQTLKDLPPLEEFEEALAADGDALAETLAGVDHEERVLRQAAELEDREKDEPAPEAAAAPEQEVVISEEEESAEEQAREEEPADEVPVTSMETP